MQLAGAQAKRWLWISTGAGLAAVVILVATGQLMAQVGDTVEIFACQHPRTGVIVVVADHDECASDWNPLIWNVEGIQGESGLQGIPGVPGDQGSTGPQGTPGDPGPEGAAGSRGDDGLIGPQGQQGDNGPIGPQGQQGDVGPIGLQGLQGDAGVNSPRFITIPITGAGLGGDALLKRGAGSTAGIVMSGTGVISFVSFGLTLPPDYETGTNLSVQVVANVAAASCQAVLAPDFLSVSRPGRAHLVGDINSSGLVSAPSSAIPATASEPYEIRYTIESPDSTAPLEALDSIIFGLLRDPFNDADTCESDLTVQGVSVTYG